MLTQNEMTAAVVEVYDDRARLAAELAKTQDSIRAVYKRFGDKLGCLPNYVDVDKAIDTVLAYVAKAIEREAECRAEHGRVE